MSKQTTLLAFASLAGGLALLLSCSTIGSIPSPGASSAPTTSSSALPSVAGNWTGTWNDTRYSKSGALAATFNVSGTNVTATGSIDLTSLGLGNQTGTASGSISGNSITLNFSSNAVGNGTATLNGGNGSGSGTVTGSLNYGAFTFTGTATDSAINGTFQFTSATGGHGTVTMQKN
jgi:hypothetical protein